MSSFILINLLRFWRSILLVVKFDLDLMLGMPQAPSKPIEPFYWSTWEGSITFIENLNINTFLELKLSYWLIHLDLFPNLKSSQIPKTNPNSIGLKQNKPGLHLHWYLVIIFICYLLLAIFLGHIWIICILIAIWSVYLSGIYW